MFIQQLGHRLELSDKAPRVVAPVDIAKCLPPVKTASYVDEQDDDFGDSKPPTLEVRRSPGRGLGLFTRDPIKAYTEIVNDAALLSLALGEDVSQLWQKYLTLPKNHQKIFDELNHQEVGDEKERRVIAKLRERGHDETTARKMARVSAIFMGNSFKASDDPVKEVEHASSTPQRWAYALFPTVARMNHSCTPNSHAHYDENTGAQRVYAVHDIEAGTELELSYFDFTMPLADRQARTQNWGFQCACAACTPTSALRRGGYEKHLVPIHTTTQGRLVRANTVAAVAFEEDARSSIQAAQREDYPWLVAALPRLYRRWFQRVYAQCWGSCVTRESILDNLEREMMWQIRLTGKNSRPTRECRRRLEEWKRATDEDQRRNAVV